MQHKVNGTTIIKLQHICTLLLNHCKGLTCYTSTVMTYRAVFITHRPHKVFGLYSSRTYSLCPSIPKEPCHGSFICQALSSHPSILHKGLTYILKVKLHNKWNCKMYEERVQLHTLHMHAHTYVHIHMQKASKVFDDHASTVTAMPTQLRQQCTGNPGLVTCKGYTMFYWPWWRCSPKWRLIWTVNFPNWY